MNDYGRTGKTAKRVSNALATNRSRLARTWRRVPSSPSQPGDGTFENCGPLSLAEASLKWSRFGRPTPRGARLSKLFPLRRPTTNSSPSPLDEITPERWTPSFTSELLELLWVLEETLATYPRQVELLEAVISGPVFTAEDLPEVLEEARKAPLVSKRGSEQLQHL